MDLVIGYSYLQLFLRLKKSKSENLELQERAEKIDYVRLLTTHGLYIYT